MENNLDIVMREDDFALYENGKPLLTAKGNPVCHPNARLLRMAVSHQMCRPCKGFTPLAMLETYSDAKAGTTTLPDQGMGTILEQDPLLLNAQPKNMTGLNELIESAPALFDLIYLNASSLSSALNSFFSANDETKDKKSFLLSAIDKLTTEQQTALKHLMNENGQGIVIHFLFITGHLSVSEYANSLIVARIKEKHPETIKALNATEGLSSCLKNLSENAVVVSDFLTLCKSSNKVSVVEEIIARGEDGQTEFKSTLRWDLYQNKKNPAIEHASLKTICAFLNSEGGNLLIGVRDDGSIEGIETDKFPNDDKFLLHLWTLIKTCMGQEVVEWVKTSLQKIDNRLVCRVHCQKAQKPVFLNQKGFDEAFYVRVGPSSGSLDISAALKYIKEHF
ncbi:MAG: ATP-binding protein [Prolixibacteraceae bacterium]|nr:ATP-binding protein [Prolixibacteraceae bacterium]